MYRRLFIILLALAFCLSSVCYAAETVPEFYRKSLSDDLPDRKGDLSDIEKEIKDQAQAVLASLNVDADKALADFSLDNAVKTAVSRGSPQNAYEKLKTVVNTFVNGDMSPFIDKYDYSFLEYGWKVPVLETETHYIFASILIHSPEDISTSASKDISITTTFAPKNGLSDLTYLFDRELVTSILKDSGITADYDAMLPISLPALYTDVIVFSTGSGFQAIPFSARPDLLGIVNGSVYDTDALTGILGLYVQSQGGADTSSEAIGGSEMSTDSEQPSNSTGITGFMLPTVITVAVACLVYWFINKKSQHKM